MKKFIVAALVVVSSFAAQAESVVCYETDNKAKTLKAASFENEVASLTWENGDFAYALNVEKISDGEFNYKYTLLAVDNGTFDRPTKKYVGRTRYAFTPVTFNDEVTCNIEK